MERQVSPAVIGSVKPDAATGTMIIRPAPYVLSPAGEPDHHIEDDVRQAAVQPAGADDRHQRS